MSRAFALLIIGLVFGGGIGFILAAANGVTLDGHDHATDHGPAVSDRDPQSGEAATHDHSQMIDVTGPAPTLSIEITPDPVSGWNLHVVTTHFTFSPDNSGGAHVNGEGHGHLYANGVKLARLYGPWFHIGTLPEGTVEIQVTLNSNDHQALAVAGVPLEAKATILNAF